MTRKSCASLADRGVGLKKKKNGVDTDTAIVILLFPLCGFATGSLCTGVLVDFCS